MNYIKRRANAILGFAIPAGFLIIAAVGLMWGGLSIYFYDPKAGNEKFIQIMAMTIVGGLCFLLSNAASLFSTIIVLSTNWQEDQLEKRKMIWGFLGVFLLGWIAGITWALIAKNYASQYVKVVGPTEPVVEQKPIDPIDPGVHPTAPGRNVYF